jgi:hypothetical protein
VTKETTEQAVFLGRLSATAEMLRSCRAAGILLALVHLLFELLGLLLVDEAQPRQALLELKGVEKGAVLVVHPGVEDLLVPNDTTAGLRDVHHLEPVGIADQIVGEDDCALEACIGPFCRVRVCYIESCDADSLDLVGLLGHVSLDGVLVLVAKDGRHFGRERRPQFGLGLVEVRIGRCEQDVVCSVRCAELCLSCHLCQDGSSEFPPGGRSVRWARASRQASVEVRASRW